MHLRVNIIFCAPFLIWKFFSKDRRVLDGAVETARWDMTNTWCEKGQAAK
jgi:hypothetical protein